MPALIRRNQAEKPDLGIFMVLDLVSDELCKADLVVVRDWFTDLPHSLVGRAIRNLKHSGARLLLTTTYPGHAENIDVEIGGFRPIDLEKSPFNLPHPLELIPETEGETSGKTMALWDVNTL